MVHLKLSFPETIGIVNNSNLPLPVALKVEGEFVLLTKELTRCEQKVKFELKVKELREICVGFKGSLLDEPRVARTFNGKLKAFSLGKLQCSVNLQANIVYPTLDISCSELNIINNMLPRACTFTLTNSGQMQSNFTLSFSENAMIVTEIQEQKQEKLLNVAQSLMKQKCNLRETFFKPDAKELEIKSIIEDILDFPVESEIAENEENLLNSQKIEKAKKSNVKQKAEAASLKSQVVSSLSSLHQAEEEVTLGDIQKFFKQLTRGLSKTLCNNDDASRRVTGNSVLQDAEKEVLAHEKCLRLSQSEGKLKPKESRIISIYFTGSSKGEFKSFRTN